MPSILLLNLEKILALLITVISKCLKGLQGSSLLWTAQVIVNTKTKFNKDTQVQTKIRKSQLIGSYLPLEIGSQLA